MNRSLFSRTNFAKMQNLSFFDSLGMKGMNLKPKIFTDLQSTTSFNSINKCHNVI